MQYNREILRLAIPNIISNLSVPMLSVVDTALVGHLPDSYSIGAVAVGSMIFNFVYWGFGFLRMGTTGLTAQAHGKNAPRQAGLVLGRAILVAFLSAAAVIMLQWPIAKLSFFLVDSSVQVERYASRYFFIRIYAAPATLGLYALLGWFLGMQNARFPMWITIFVNLINVALDALFVLKLDLGVAGVALGTVIAQYAGFLLGLFFLFRYYHSYVLRYPLTEILERSALVQFFKVNSDIFIRTLCLIFVFSFFTAKSAEFGDDILAANAILIQLWMVFSYGIDGFAFAAESLVGKITGAGDIRRLKQMIRSIFIWGAGMGLGFSVAYGMFDRALIAFFTNQQNVIALSLQFMGWTIIAPLINSFCYIWDGVYIGATASKAMRNAMLLSTLVFFLPVYYFGRMYLGNHGMWLALLIFMAARGISLTVLAPAHIFGRVKKSALRQH